MQQAWMVGPFVMKIALLVLVISIFAGFIFFRMMSPFSKEKTKKYLADMETLLFTLILFIWFGKILLQAPTFFSDPIAILAHPSNSTAFYIGIVLTVIYSKWKIIKSDRHLLDLLLSFLYLFFPSFFIYEFTSMLVDGRQTLLSFMLFIIFFIFFILMQNRISNEKLIAFTITGLGLSYGIISLFHPTFVFQYAVHSWFWFLTSLSGITLYYRLNRKRSIQ